MTSCLGQTIILSEKARASLITCETGNESYSLFGHTAIRIADVENNLDLVYNYGAFDFQTPNFVAKFAKGDLQYFAVANTFTDFIFEYNYIQRGVYEQELEIPPVYKQKLFDNLNAVLSSEKSNYTYRFIDQNCTTMVVDILNKTLGDTIIKENLDREKTYRSILFPYFDNFFYEKLGTSIIFGTKVDEKSNHIFLPFGLLKNLQQTQFKNKLLCKETKTLLEFKKESPNSWWNSIYSYLILLGFILVLNKNYIDLFYLSAMGFLGIFFLVVGVLSFHQELACNYNILLFNPLLFILAYLLVIKNKKWTVIAAVFNMILFGIYLIIITNKAHLLIVLPLVITNFVLLGKIIFKNSKRIPVVI